MTIKTILAAFATLALLSAGAAHAQTSGPAEKSAATAKAKTPRSEKSLECSKQAAAKGLHGKERKKFRSECKKS